MNDNIECLSHTLLFKLRSMVAQLVLQSDIYQVASGGKGTKSYPIAQKKHAYDEKHMICGHAQRRNMSLAVLILYVVASCTYRIASRTIAMASSLVAMAPNLLLDRVVSFF